MQAKAQDDDVVMNLVELALARPSEEREDYLRSVCAADTELFNQVQNYVRWEERMNGFLLDPLCPPLSDERPFEAGQVLDHRFRIVREVAEGGMGVVYEAVDEKLERRIAIKCAKAGFRKRLPPEVRNASEISHPNVCKIFEIHTAPTDRGEIDFLTMEFLEGETLTERLSRGPLPEPEARTIARQLSEGLAEAHRNRVIHGDLKSNNVILTTGADGATRAVITDFGLARRPEAVQRNVQSGELAGTPDYMAPELWKGQQASVASDLYALGVILYELASGHRPSGPEIGLPERLTRKPPAVHPKWDRILARCLEPDPAGRFRDAEEVGKAFGPSLTRHRLLAAAAAVVLAIVTGTVTYQRATAPKESVRLVMLPFEAGADLVTVADKLSRDVASQLDRLKGSKQLGLSVVSWRDVLRENVDTIEKAQAALGTTHVLHGVLQRQGTKVALHAILTDARKGVNSEWTAEYVPGQVRYAPIALAGFVTGTLKLPPLVIAATVKPSAQQDYWAGMWYVRQNSTLDASLAAFQRAIADDPDSPLTWGGLAEAQWFEYYLTKEPVWLDRTRDSVRQAESRNPDVAPAHRVEGYLDYTAGTYERAVPEFERAIELQPNNAMAHIYLGKSYEDSGQFDQALTEFNKAVQVEPNYFRTYQNLGAFYLQRSKFTESAKQLNNAVELAPREPILRWGLAVIYMSLGRFAEAEQELRYSLALQETVSAFHTLGENLLHQGRDREAVEYFLRALSFNAPPGGTQRYLTLMYLGIAYRRLHLFANAEESNRRGLELVEAEIARNPRDGYIRGFLGYFNAVAGNRVAAESDIAQALRLFPDDSVTRARAVLTYEEIFRTFRDPTLRDKTLEVLRACTTEQIADINRWPDLTDLRTDYRFLQLLALHQIK